jgi:hypothetical protein
MTQYSWAHELNCQVQVVTPKLQNNSANTEIFNNLQIEVLNFMNNTKWTQEVITDDEQIDCSILITLDKEVSTGNYEGSIQIQYARPVYNSSYLSPVFTFKDTDFQISYQRNTALIFTPDRHTSNLTSILAFYAYLILGYDYDTFSLEGGTKYFLKAQQIVTNAGNTPFNGWKTDSDRRNRFHIIDNILQSVFKPLRKCTYDYHLKGFDVLYDKQDEGLNVIISALKEIRKVHRIRANTINQQLFFTAKMDELKNLFSEANQSQKTRFLGIVKEVNAVNMSTYNKINKN